jgi:hypothetical protein
MVATAGHAGAVRAMAGDAVLPVQVLAAGDVAAGLRRRGGSSGQQHQRDGEQTPHPWRHATLKIEPSA